MTSAAVTVPASPYKGLGAFDESELDALFFFGREGDTETIAANLLAARFTVLFGATGVGKSSVLRASVVHRVRALAPDSLVVVHDAWAGDPAQGLRATLAAATGTDVDVDGDLATVLDALTASVGGDVYLVLDQFEELFVYRNSSAFARELAGAVTSADLRSNVLVAIRDDQLSRLDALTGFLPDVFGNALPIDHLGRDAARTAITGPIARYNELVGAGISIEDDLVDAVLDEVAVGRVALGGVGVGSGEPGPGDRIETAYLQLVMQQLWEAERARGSDVLRHRTLVDLGGAQEIVRADFDRAIASLPPAEQDVAARVFNHLVTPSGTKIAHRLDDLARYASVDERRLHSVVRALSGDRILRPLGDRVEIFHDVLADAVLAWSTQHEAQRALAEQRKESERRHRTILVALAASLVALAAMIVLAIYALSQRTEARDRAAAARVQARRAQARTLDTQAGRLIPVLLSQRDPELGMLLAARAARLSPTTEAEDTLRRALAVSFLRRVLPERGVVSASFDAHGDRLVVASRGGRVVVYAGDERTRIATLDAATRVHAAFPSPDGRFVLALTRGPTLLWDLQSSTRRELPPAEAAAIAPTGALAVTAAGGEGRVWQLPAATAVTTFTQPEQIRQLAFSPRGDLVLAFGAGRLVRIYDARTGRPVRTIDHRALVTSALVTPDDKTVVTGGANKLARSWSIDSGRLLQGFRGHSGRVTSLALSPGGRLVLATSTDTSARVWNLASGSLVTPLVGHTGAVEGGLFSRDAGSVLTWSDDGTARLWRADGDVIKAILAAPGGAIGGASLGAGNAVVTESADGRARLWEAPLRPALAPVAAFLVPVRAAAFSRDGSTVAVARHSAIVLDRARDGRQQQLIPAAHIRSLGLDDDGSLVAAATSAGVRVWSASTGRRTESLPVRASAVAVSSRHVAFGERDGTLTVRGLNGGAPVVLHGPDVRVTSVGLSRDDRFVAAGYSDGRVAAWRIGDRRRLFVKLQHRPGTPVTSVTFDRRGSRLATTGRDSNAFVLDARSGALLAAFVDHIAAVSGAAFSPDGRWLVTAGPGTAGLWDLTTGQRFAFLDGHRGLLLAASFDRSGRRVSTVGADGTLRAYTCTLCGGIHDLLRLAQQRLAATGRTLTAAERRKYLAP